MICEEDCQSKLEGLQTITAPSGLKYKEIAEGKGTTPPVGYQASLSSLATAVLCCIW